MRLSFGALDLRDGKGYVLDGSEIPYPDLASVMSLLPQYAQSDDAGAMRDAVLNTIAKIANKVWADTGLELNAFVSPRYSSGPMLAIWGLIRKMPRAVGESIAAYRTRLLAADDGVTPNAIKRAVLAAAEQFGEAKIAFQEPADDCSFFDDNDPTSEAYCSFFQDDNAIFWNYDPTVDNETTGGYFVDDKSGAQFWIIMQLDAGSDATSPHFLADTDLGDDPEDFFADDVGTDDTGFLAFDGDPLETRIVSEVNARAAFGVTWMLIEDPNLNGAI